MAKQVTYGKCQRMSYGQIEEVIDIPDLVAIQKDSYKWFVEEGMQEVLDDVSPITDFTDDIDINFENIIFDTDKPIYSIAECKERDTNYAAPMKVMVTLTRKTTGNIERQAIFIGDFPIMTETGTFIINGAERVIISQLVRSPGAYYSVTEDKNGSNIYSGQMIPNRGAWLEFENDANGILTVRVDRTRKFPLTIFLRALGFGSDEDIIEAMGSEPRLMETMHKDGCTDQEDGLREVFRRLRPGEVYTKDGAMAHIQTLFFDDARYDLAKVGIFKLNKKLSLATRIKGHKLAQDVVDRNGEVVALKDSIIDEETAWAIQNSGVNALMIRPIRRVGTHQTLEEAEDFKVIGNGRVDLRTYVEAEMGKEYAEILDPAETGVDELVFLPNLETLIESAIDRKLSPKEFKILISSKVSRRSLMPRKLHTEDILAVINYFIGLQYAVGTFDDIDHLGNRRIRSVGELLQNQMRIGFTRLERMIKERMQSIDHDRTITPASVINTRPVSAAFKEFFGSSQLSQFLDQPNPLAELTHKRRLSALGPGGLSRDRANFEVRDVHSSHYGRMCPIETPEGPNIGLINSLACFARVNKYGFIETPYRLFDKETLTVKNEVSYLTADEEDYFNIAQANEPLDENNHFVNDRIVCRYVDRFLELPPEKVDFMDVSPKQLVSVATSLIPFLGNDDAARALMGSNMQRQAVPLIRTESPLVGTGMEYRAAKDSGVCVVAKRAGVVCDMTASYISVKSDDGEIDTYKLSKYVRSNQGTCFNQRPIVSLGDRVEADEVIADGPSTQNGELALGRNALIGFMTWEGYNYEDAVLISRRLVKEDIYTSIHIEEYECEARDTKLGAEEITREIPNVGDESMADLDEAGVIRIGAEVRAGDILVGKVTPKGETEVTPEERLYRSIFGDKVREVRDTSTRVPHGESGTVVDIKEFTRENGDELKHGVIKLVRVYVAQKRKISVGDKMAGRHGNKGVISRILPEEDMPFMPDGTPLDIVLNPLGIPSRMNIGQLLEVHLGLLAAKEGIKVATPVFDGASENDIAEAFEKASLDPDGKTILYDGRTGEPFENRVTVGVMYYLKLNHLVDDKIHARSIGPYALVTQQPLGGKAQFGGQRFGEMEVWALEAYGAAHILQEILTVKSDDIAGRTHTYEAIVKGRNIPRPNVPEAFNVLVKELQSMALDVQIYSEDNSPLELKKSSNDDEGYASEPFLASEKDSSDALDFADLRELAVAGIRTDMIVPDTGLKNKDKDKENEEEEPEETDETIEEIKSFYRYGYNDLDSLKIVTDEFGEESLPQKFLEDLFAAHSEEFSDATPDIFQVSESELAEAEAEGVAETAGAVEAAEPKDTEAAEPADAADTAAEAFPEAGAEELAEDISADAEGASEANEENTAADDETAEEKSEDD